MWGRYRIESEHMTLEECAVLVGLVLDDHGCNPVAVLDGRGRRRGAADRGLIKLPRFARNVPYVLHEVAHVILDQRGYGVTHGPEFAAQLLSLWRVYGKDCPTSMGDAAALAGEMKPRRVVVAPKAPVSIIESSDSLTPAQRAYLDAILQTSYHLTGDEEKDTDAETLDRMGVTVDDISQKARASLLAELDAFLAKFPCANSADGANCFLYSRNGLQLGFRCDDEWADNGELISAAEACAPVALRLNADGRAVLG